MDLLSMFDASDLAGADAKAADAREVPPTTPLKPSSSAMAMVLLQSPSVGSTSPGSCGSPSSVGSSPCSLTGVGLGVGKRSAYGMKMPNISKTGNEEIDEQAESNRQLLMDVIDVCLDNPKHILPLFGSLKKRLAQVGQPQGPG